MRIALLLIASLAIFSQSASAQCSSGSCSASVVTKPWRPPPFQWSQSPGFYVHVQVGQTPPSYPGYTRVLVQSVQQTQARVRIFQGGFFRRLFGGGGCG